MGPTRLLDQSSSNKIDTRKKRKARKNPDLESNNFIECICIRKVGWYMMFQVVPPTRGRETMKNGDRTQIKQYWWNNCRFWIIQAYMSLIDYLWCKNLTLGANYDPHSKMTLLPNEAQEWFGEATRPLFRWEVLCDHRFKAKWKRRATNLMSFVYHKHFACPNTQTNARWSRKGSRLNLYLGKGPTSRWVSVVLPWSAYQSWKVFSLSY